MLIHDNKTLLLHRPYTNFAHNLWALPGGRLDGNETVRQAMVREAYEELGITVKAEDLTFMHVVHEKFIDKELIAFFFSAHTWEGTAYNKEPEKHSKAEWFDIDKLPHDLHRVHIQGLACAKKNISYSEFGFE